MVLTAAAIVGCDSGSWVDAPTVCSFRQMADNEKAQGKTVKAEDEEAVAGLTKMTAQSVCGNVGKSFTGDVDCEGSNSRVKCK
jgi:hypothetical protein